MASLDVIVAASNRTTTSPTAPDVAERHFRASASAFASDPNHTNETTFDPREMEAGDSETGTTLSLPLICLLLGMCVKLILVLWLIKTNSFKRFV